MIALVTGASRGVGRGIALSLAEKQADVYITGRTQAALDDTAEEIQRRGGRAVVHLAQDPDVMRHTGQVLTAGRLAREYDFTDVDGRRPPPFEMPPDFCLD